MWTVATLQQQQTAAAWGFPPTPTAVAVCESMAKDKGQEGLPVNFGKFLAHTDKVVRDRGFKRLKRWLVKHPELERLEYMKVWKGLYFAVWMADKRPVQQELAVNIALLLNDVPQEKRTLWIDTFWETMKVSWEKLDVHRTVRLPRTAGTQQQQPGQELRPPVRVVVFDCDETLTLSTFLPDDAALRTQLDWTSPWEEYIATVNFESPFATSGRLALLREMLEDLRRGTRKLPGRLLAVLTRNTNGPVACLNLLRAAKLADLFDAVWCMSHDWLAFEPPLASLPDHKAHVIHNIAEQPSAWFPQKTDGSLMSMLPDPLRTRQPQEIMLVDDVRTNFQCGGSDPKKVYRCCKVARYDAPNFRDMGLVRDMGGIGAHNEEDYKTVVDFAKRPWAYKVDWRVHCIEKPFDGAALQPPVQLVIFDFDGALTLYTFMPEDTGENSPFASC
eukprot:s5410_g2.t1